MGNLIIFNEGISKWINGEYIEKPEITGMKYNITFDRKMAFKKANTTFVCMGCGKDCVKGTRYIGDTYEKICYRCVPEWTKKTKITLDEIKGTCDNIKEEIKKNKEKWEKEILVNSLE